jgi:predicted nuclease of restriction endonuclease-like (RecB) superfamily
MKRKPPTGKKTLRPAGNTSVPDVGAVPASYAALLTEIKDRVRSAQLRAHLAVNRELVLLYWQIGRDIVSRQKLEGWGKSVIERLAADIQREFPGIEGFSTRNIWRMRAFYLAYAQLAEFLSQPVTELLPEPLAETASETGSARILPQPVAELESPGSASAPTEILPQAVAEPPPLEVAAISWAHNVILLEKLSDTATRLWYARQAAQHGWSRNVLAIQIDSALHERQGKAVTNFAQTLPPPQSDLAQQITKDPYLFDFLNLRDDANERAVEMGLLEHVEKFLLELGAGFALVGRQVHLEVGGQDFYLDLLFYHLHLRCFLVVDLKARDFTPEAAGKMNFYLSAVDDRFRHASDQPSIGLILCREKNRVIAEYALRDIQKPVGVSGYVTRLVETLPAPLKDAIPSVAELERGLTDFSD